MIYPQHHQVIEDARSLPSLWRLAAGLATALAACLAWVVAVIWVSARLGVIPHNIVEGGAGTPQEALVFLTMIVGLGIGTWVAARFWQHRGLRSLLGRGPVVLSDFAMATLITWAVAAILAGITLPFSDPIEHNLEFGVWVMWLPVALIAIAFQTGSEELLFRGYLQSQLAARFRHPAVWLFIPALLFGGVHFAPSLPLSAGLTYVALAAFFGLIAGDLTARTGNIGAAWGLHFANNCIAILVLVTEGSLTGLGLYRSGELVDELSLSPLLIIDLIVMIFVWLLVRRMVTR